MGAEARGRTDERNLAHALPEPCQRLLEITGIADAGVHEGAHLQATQLAQAGARAHCAETRQQAIESRDKLRQRIIERRVEELLDPNVNWDATSKNRNLPAPGVPEV